MQRDGSEMAHSLSSSNNFCLIIHLALMFVGRIKYKEYVRNVHHSRLAPTQENNFIPPSNLCSSVCAGDPHRHILCYLRTPLDF